MDSQVASTVHEVFPYLRVKNAAAALSYYQQAFGAKLRYQLNEPGTGRIGHAELELGPAVIMVSDE